MAERPSAAVVTGAASGIGRAIVERLRGRFDYVACFDVDPEVRESWADDANVHGFEVDVREYSVVASAVEVVEAEADVVAVVNNAGISRAVGLADLNSDEWDRVLDVNLKGQYTVTRATTPAMTDRGDGAIVNVSSVAGLRGSATGGVHYSSSKAGVFGLTKGLAKQLGPEIRVNCVAPGLVETPLLTESNLWTDERLGAYAAELPSERIGTPDEVARVVDFLCGPGSSYMTGSVVTVDGGSTLR